MMHVVRRLLVSLIGFTAIALVHADDPILGRFLLHVSSEDARSARLSGKEAPYGHLAFRENHRFVLDTPDLYRSGRYIYDEGHIVLLPNTGGEIQANIVVDRVTVGDLAFDRENVPAYAYRRFPTDISTGRRPGEILSRRAFDDAPRPDPVEERHVTMQDRPARPVEVPLPEIVAKVPAVSLPVAPAIRTLDPKLVVGVWTVRHDGHEEKDQRMELREDGTFRFAMKGATSEGTWKTERGMIVLIYAKVDDQPLEDGASGRKEISVALDASAFMIDTYRYERATDK